MGADGDPCGGVLISTNTFTNNFGCYRYGGSLVTIQCVPDLTTITYSDGSYIEYVDYD